MTAFRSLALVINVAQALEREGVRYCHWKSNDPVGDSPSSGLDLDLLVSMRDKQRFLSLLEELEFKEARPAPPREVPGVAHFYGLDVSSGHLVHVHAYYRLVVGDDKTKNYRLPVEESYLSSALRGRLFMEPSKEFEYIVFIIRMVLKHLAADAILCGRAKLSEREQYELNALMSRARPVEIRAIFREHLPFLDQALFDECAASLQNGSPARERARLAHRVQLSLSPYSRRSEGVDACLKVWRRGSELVQKRFFGRRSRKILTSGGALIALVGGDGAGKSTAAEGLNGWLAGGLSARRIHMGKPPPSLARRVFSIAEAVEFRASSAVRHIAGRSDGEGELDREPRYMMLMHQTLRARDRYRTYLNARAFVLSGGIVVCDRYPLRHISLMDGPRLSAFTTEECSGMRQYLIQREAKYYEQIKDPNILIVLKVPPDVAMKRRAEEDVDVVRLRSLEIWEADWAGGEAMVVDAGRSENEVLSEIKALVWSRL